MFPVSVSQNVFDREIELASNHIPTMVNNTSLDGHFGSTRLAFRENSRTPEFFKDYVLNLVSRNSLKRPNKQTAESI
jgi:hypothetical protein